MCVCARVCIPHASTNHQDPRVSDPPKKWMPSALAGDRVALSEYRIRLRVGRCVGAATLPKRHPFAQTR